MKKFFTKCLLAVSILLLPTITLAETTIDPYKNTYNNFYYKGAIEKDGHLYVPLQDLFSELKAPIIWNKKTNSIKVFYKNTLIEYFIGARYANVNMKRTKMNAKTILLDGKVYIPLQDTAQFLSSELTRVELDQIKLKYFWGYAFEMYVLGTETSNAILPYGHYTVEDAIKIVDRYEGNHVDDHVFIDFKGMEGNYYLFHTYYIPDYEGNQDDFLLNSSELMNQAYTIYLWNRYYVHKDTGELIVQ